MTVLPAILSLVVYLAGVVALVVRARRPHARPATWPKVSILKPLAGHDDDLADNLASFARIDYPEYEILFGIASTSDPALAAARAFQRLHPFVASRIVVTDPDAAINPKVAQLIGLEKASSGEVLVISDSNVRVRPEYLTHLVAELERPGVGLVSSVVVGTGERSLGAAVENLNLCGTIAPIQALVAAAGRILNVGKSMAMWRTALASVGGLRVVEGVLAEDYLLGGAFERGGFGVRLCTDPVENRNLDCGLARAVERHARWARMRLSLARSTFLFEPLGSPIVVATLCAIADRSRLTAGALALSVVLQTAGALTCTWHLRGTLPKLRFLPVEVLRSYLLAATWLSAFFGRRIVWRGHVFRLETGSVLVPLHDSDRTTSGRGAGVRPPRRRPAVAAS